MQLRKKIGLGILFIAIIGVVFWGGIGFMKYKNSINTLQPQAIEFKNLDDGKYSGHYDMNYVSVSLEFTIAHGLLTEIDLIEHKNGKGEPAEVLLSEFIEKQTTDVDVVSGATASSKAILLSMENAEKITK